MLPVLIRIAVVEGVATATEASMVGIARRAVLGVPYDGRHRMPIIRTAKHLPEQALLEHLAKVFKVDVSELILASARVIDKAATPPEALPRFEQLPDGKLRLHINGVVVSEATGLSILTLLRADAQRQ